MKLRARISTAQKRVAQQNQMFTRMEYSQPAALMENYYYPCDVVIEYEKTLIKHSIVWDYAH